MRIPDVVVSEPDAVPGPRLLVVEDQRGSAELMLAAAAEVGLACEVVTTGASALAAIARDAPLAVILDLRLPDMRGEDVRAALQADAATEHVPVLVVSIEDDTGSSRRLGAHDHLTRPVDRARLRAWLLELRARPDGPHADPAG